MPGRSERLLTPSDGHDEDAIPQLPVLGRAVATPGRAVNVQELSGCKERRRLVASRVEKPGPWV